MRLESIIRKIEGWETHTVAVARCHGSVHDGLIRGFNGKDALEVWVQM